MANLSHHLGHGEQIVYKFRPSRKAFLGEYILFIFVMLLSFTSLYPLIMSGLKNIVILATIAKIVFYVLFAVSIFLLVRVEFKVWSRLYALTNHRIMISKGIFTEKFTGAVYSKITDAGLEQSFWNKILNVGTIDVNTAGGDNMELVFEDISRPIDVKRKISDLQATQHHLTSATHNPVHHMQN
jgi:uncharacterized membrane protein YdbT with pleckstrin-like domain